MFFSCPSLCVKVIQLDAQKSLYANERHNYWFIIWYEFIVISFKLLRIRETAAIDRLQTNDSYFSIRFKLENQENTNRTQQNSF